MANDIGGPLAIRGIRENWVLWRDARRWDRFRTLWHPEGEMWATWFQGSYEEFIAVSQQGYDRGVRIHHMVGGTSMDIAGERAIADTKVSIAQRADVDGVECDVTCWGRMYDFLEKRQGRWGIVLRRLTYEKDRIDPTDPSATLTLGAAPPPCARASPSSPGIWRFCRPASATRSRTICPASKGRHSRRSTRKLGRG